MAIYGPRLASSNYLTCDTNANFQPGRTITAMFWGRPAVIPGASNYWICCGSSTVASASGWGVALRGKAGAVASWDAFFSNNGTNYDDYSFTATVTVGQWDHVAWVLRSDSSETGYLNGIEQALTQHSNAGTYPAETSRVFEIRRGDVGGNGSFDGTMACVRIFDGELAAAEIQAEMLSWLAVNKRLPVIADYPMRDLGGLGSTMVVPDYGPRGLHVTGIVGTGISYADDPPLVTPAPKLLTLLRTIPQPAGGTTYNQTNTGSCTPAGALVRQSAKNPAGTVTPTGALTRDTTKSQAGSITPAGVLSRLAGKSMAGEVAPSGVLIRQGGKALAGSLTPDGAVQRSTAKLLAGTVAATGALAKQTAKRFLGLLTPAGSVVSATSGAAVKATSTGTVTAGRTSTAAVTARATSSGGVA